MNFNQQNVKMYSRTLNYLFLGKGKRRTINGVTGIFFIECHPFKLLGNWTNENRIRPFLSSPSPKVQILVKGLGVTLKSHGPPTPPTTFNHEGVL